MVQALEHLLAVLLVPLVQVSRFDWLLTREDTRAAGEWSARG